MLCALKSALGVPVPLESSMPVDVSVIPGHGMILPAGGNTVISSTTSDPKGCWLLFCLEEIPSAVDSPAKFGNVAMLYQVSHRNRSSSIRRTKTPLGKVHARVIFPFLGVSVNVGCLINLNPVLYFF